MNFRTLLSYKTFSKSLSSSTIKTYQRHLSGASSNVLKLVNQRKSELTFLPRETNQVQGIAQFAVDFMAGKLGKGPSAAVLKRVELFHTDSVVCGISALALGTNAPLVLREEALTYKHNPKTGKGATVFGSEERIMPEKAVVANSSAVREWDSNGTVFGYNKEFGHTAGEFGHNDYYPVVIAACQMAGLDGKTALRAMLLLDEIRGRLAEVFSLKSYKIDHVVHGAIASAIVYGTLLGANISQLESAVGMVLAHYIPWRAIRAGHQLSDSKGASAAISAEIAVLSVHRALRGFIGPKDVFRNPEAIFRFFQPTKGDIAPFDLVLSHSGDDFAVMGMHFKLGLYEHQSAGALQGLIDVIRKNPNILNEEIKSIKVVAYQPAFGIIGDPAKRDPHTRQSADHSMVYIVATKLHKAIQLAKEKKLDLSDNDGVWKSLMLMPIDYSLQAINDRETRKLMAKIEFAHGGPDYDIKYPDGIPTSLVIKTTKSSYDSGFIMYPSGHARNTSANLENILQHKFTLLTSLAVNDVNSALKQLSNLNEKSAKEINGLYNLPIKIGENRGEY